MQYACDHCHKRFKHSSAKYRHQAKCTYESEDEDDPISPEQQRVLDLEALVRTQEQLIRLQVRSSRLQATNPHQTQPAAEPVPSVPAIATQVPAVAAVPATDQDNESFYQGIMERVTGAGHKRLSTGVTDITIDGVHAEIKRWSCWSEALGQLDKYNHADYKPEARAYMFGKCSESQKAVALDVFLAKGIRVFDLVRSEGHMDVVEMTREGNRQAFRVAV